MTFRLTPSTAPICSSGNWWPSAARIWARQISRDGCKPLERSALTALRSDLDKWISIRCMALKYRPLLTCQCTRGPCPDFVQAPGDCRESYGTRERPACGERQVYGGGARHPGNGESGRLEERPGR